MNPDRKKCCRCGEAKPLESFYRAKRNKDGRKGACKACLDAIQREYAQKNPERVSAAKRRYIERHPEKRKQQALDWYYRNQEETAEYRKEYRARPEVQARERAYSHQWFQANREKVRANTERWREANWETFLASSRESKRRARAANPHAHRERVKRWRQENPEKYTRQMRALYASRSGVPTDTHALDYMDILASDPCVYCGARCEHIDHIVPIAGGGTSYWDNLTAACQACNNGKYTSPFVLFMARRVTTTITTHA